MSAPLPPRIRTRETFPDPEPGAMTSLHFAPPLNWMNDPNGLVFHDGRYHLFFQHNPLGTVHENISWGHASSLDLATWELHPLAIPFDEDEEIFSGSIVLDGEGSTGLGTPENPALIAFYTSMSKRDGTQAQSIAYSLDAGTSWTKYAGNPVLDRGSLDFRDPKVFRWTGTDDSYWVMIAAEAEERQMVLYRSDDLLSWSHLSTFGPAGAVGGVWECPDLFPLRLEGTDETHWVLLVSLNPGGIAGGSGTQYFVGDFDGTTFTPLEPRRPVEASDPEGMRELDWLDYGRDCYAGVTFSGLPDDERTLIAWMGNWDYAREMPVDPRAPQRGAMTLPRRLSLVSEGGRPVLRQTPIGPELAEEARLEGLEITDRTELAMPVPAAGRIEATVAVGGAAGFVLRLDGEEGRSIELSYDAGAGELRLDRRGAAAGFPDSFGSVERMPLRAGVPIEAAEPVELVIWVDERAIEVYAGGGVRVLTDLVGGLRTPRISAEGVGGAVTLTSMTSARSVASAAVRDTESVPPARAAVIGEALVDVVEGVAYPGGSPLNVAIGLSRLGVPTVLHTRIGSDDHGRVVSEHLSRSGVELAQGSLVEGPTATAVATIDAEGRASYEFDMDWSIPTPDTSACSIVHTGSIGAVLEPGGRVAREAIRNAGGAALRSFDPNIRPDIMGDAETVRALVRELAALCHVVKLSDEDALWLGTDRGANPEQVLDELAATGVPFAVMTRGEQGCLAVVDGVRHERAARAVELVDTIGAGDAFMSGLLFGLVRDGSDRLLVEGVPLSAERVERALDAALASAAVAVSRPGADPPVRGELAAVRRAN